MAHSVSPRPDLTSSGNTKSQINGTKNAGFSCSTEIKKITVVFVDLHGWAEIRDRRGARSTRGVRSLKLRKY